jgi:hypothetical protein
LVFAFPGLGSKLACPGLCPHDLSGLKRPQRFIL